MKNRAIIICLLFTLAALLNACSCNSNNKSGNSEEFNYIYPYYDGDIYPDEINTAEATEAGSVYYVDPSEGSIDNNGSAAYPWNTFEDVIGQNKIQSMEPVTHPYSENSDFTVKNPGAAVHAGDTIILKAGNHGEIFIQDYFNTDYINVIAESGAYVSRLRIQSGCKWRFKGLTVTPVSGYTAAYSLVFLESHSWHGPVYNITIDDFIIYSIDDSSTWTTTDQWNSLSCNGINATGYNITLRRNYLKNVNFGLTISGNYGLAKENTIENFSGDGMRGLGNDLFFEYNTVKNCYAVNANHDDGFQSWSIDDDPPRERVVLRGNIIINYEDPDQPFRGTLQGIGCFDGWYINWVIENNVVITDHWHGISLYGAINCRIVNNTVIDLNDERPGPPWIAILDHKDGRSSYNCIIRNNISTSYIIDSGVIADHNYEIENFSDYAGLFVDPDNFDLNLLGGTTVIDSGTTDSAPSVDIEGNIRPAGAGIDPGAYEYY